MTLDPSETRAMILEALRKNGGNRGKAAESIGVPVRTFFRWIAQFARWEVEALTAEMASDGTLDRDTASTTGHGPTREEVRKAWRVALGDRDVAARLLGLCVRRTVALAREAGVKLRPEPRRLSADELARVRLLAERTEIAAQRKALDAIEAKIDAALWSMRKTLRA